MKSPGTSSASNIFICDQPTSELFSLLSMNFWIEVSIIFLTMPSRSWHQTFYFLENRFSYQIQCEVRATTLYSRFQLMDSRGCTFFIRSHPSFICLFFTTRWWFNAHDFSRGMTLKLSWRHHEKISTNRWMWRGEDTVFVVKIRFWVGEIERMPAEHGDQFVVDQACVRRGGGRGERYFDKCCAYFSLDGH